MENDTNYMLTIPLRPIIVRLILFLFLAAGFGLLGWFIVRAAIGDSIMTFVQRRQNLAPEAQIEGADLAVKYSPRDPLIHWQRGGVYFNAANEDLMEQRLGIALEDLRKAVEMSPEDYRVWLALGRVLDRAGSTVEARGALERALRLAPNHFDTRWALGNHLLRAGDRDASFAQMRLALANRPSALPIVFDYAWNVYAGDGKAIARALAPPLDIKSQLVSMLINRGKVDDGLSIWREIPSPTPKDVQRVVESLANIGRFGPAYEIWKTANIPDRPLPDNNSLLAQGDFEQQLTFNSNIPFYAWHIAPSGIMRVTLDRKDVYEGKQSLRVSFNAEGNVPITIATQTIPARPNRKYCLSFIVKTEEMESLSTPFVEVFDSADIKRAHVATPPVPTRDNKWSWQTISLNTAQATEALTVRLQRQPCSEPPCPITGRVWFDAINLVECAKPGNPKTAKSME